MIAFGILLVFVSIFTKGIYYGMPPYRNKPLYPATPMVRIITFVVGLLSFVLGLTRLQN